MSCDATRLIRETTRPRRSRSSMRPPVGCSTWWRWSRRAARSPANREVRAQSAQTRGGVSRRL